jgi:TfoX/Sxy family transcriptional regulator of competence genes
MSYDQTLDTSIARAVADWATDRKNMFGGTCYLINGNMLCGVYRDCLILRLGPEGANKALRDPQVRRFDVSGKPMKGWVMIEASTLTPASLQEWLKQSRRFVETLPAKSRGTIRS